MQLFRLHIYPKNINQFFTGFTPEMTPARQAFQVCFLM